MTKQAWRARLLDSRRALPPRDRAAGDRARDAHATQLTTGAQLAAYVSFGTEPDTGRLLRAGALLPVLRADRDLDWRAHPDGPLLGPGAVAACDVLLIPALAVDRSGVRLGRGGGSYDRALRRARGLVVALLHEGELVEELPSEAHDVRVDAVLLPSGLVRLPISG